MVPSASQRLSGPIGTPPPDALPLVAFITILDPPLPHRPAVVSVVPVV